MITAVAVLGVLAQMALTVALAVLLLRAVGVPGPWRFVRESLEGSELWVGFVLALVATAGSIYFSEVAHFVPCKLCWFQRIAMYPLVLLALPAMRNDRRAAQYFPASPSSVSASPSGTSSSSARSSTRRSRARSRLPGAARRAGSRNSATSQSRPLPRRRSP